MLTISPISGMAKPSRANRTNSHPHHLTLEILQLLHLICDFTQDIGHRHAVLQNAWPEWLHHVSQSECSHASLYYQVSIAPQPIDDL